MIINITAINLSEMAAFFDKMPDAVRRVLLLKMRQLVLELEARVKDKLSGKVLNVQTGALRRSIQNELKEARDYIEAQVYSAGDVKYAAIHEFGGITKPHIILPKAKKALKFIIGGKEIFSRMVRHKGSVMPERSYMRSSLREMAERVETLLATALEGF